jgi:nucleotide-binding universal stress UspA family protein
MKTAYEGKTMKIKKILFPTNFEHLSLPSVKSLMSLKDSGLEEVVFLFVIDRDEVAYNLLTGFDRDHAETLRAEANLRFKEWETELATYNVRSTHVVEIGTPEGKILEVAAREKVDMVVAGRRRPVPVDEVYLSGTTMGVLRRTARPVMVYRHGLERPIENKFESILFATDFSGASQRTLDFIKGLYGAAKTVDIAHILTENSFKGHSREEVEALEEKYHAKMKAMAVELREVGFKVFTHLLAGEAIHEMLNTSKDYSCTCIVMGTTGKSGFSEVWLGSVSHRVVEQANVSVILVPNKEKGDYD